MLAAMLKLLALLLTRLNRPLNLEADEVDRAFMEPLEHPAIRTLSIEEQADLPVDRTAYYEGRASSLRANST